MRPTSTPMNISTDAIFPRNFRRTYPLAVRGEGCFLWDAAGQKYMDACGGAAVVTIGHGVREVLEAAHAQAQQLSYAHTSQFFTPVAAELAANLAARFPAAGQPARVHFTSGGSEATETALKLARVYWLSRGQSSRWRVISRGISYHGATLGALAVSGNEIRRAAYAPMLAPQPLIAPCFCYRCPLGLKFPECNVACADELERAIEAAGPETVAAFICEPVVGASSGAVPPEGYLRRIREICDRFGILFIADEILCGSGRTGKYCAVEHWGVAPDMLLLGKGLAGGYAPLGAVLISEKVWRAIEMGAGQLDHGFTYQAHPPALAAGLAVQRYLEQHALVAQAAARGRYLAQRLESLRDIASVGDVRGLGLLHTVEFVAGRESKEPFPQETKMSARVFEALASRGVLVYPMRGTAPGGRGDHIMIAPPFTISEAEIDFLAAKLEEVLRELAP
jgi:adenosylmethionine-8-amino-7-oxononanoate aminotransferase